MFALALGLSFAGLLAGPVLVHRTRRRAAFEAAFVGLTVGHWSGADGLCFVQRAYGSPP